MAEAKRDGNYITTLLAVSNVDGVTPVTLYADPITHRLLVSGQGLSLLDATGTINGVNTAFTFSQQPTYIISDGVWYRVNKGWTWSDPIATMTIPPNDDIYGFA